MKILSVFALVIFSEAQALETDQFLAGSTPLKDASLVINSYINDKFEKAITKVNSRAQKKNCQELADDVMTGIVGKYSISKISMFAKKSPEIERYPDDSLSNKEYRKLSIYQEASFPFTIASMARTINVGGIYVGTDKLGHFALVGRNYYRRYLKNLEKGMNAEEAQKQSILTGMSQEVHILGYTLGGVLSYGDLEANYQGMLFSISMCEGENPYLIREAGLWKQNPNRTFDIKNYINPKMDESFIPAFWRNDLWKKVAPKIKDSYCELKRHPLYVERITNYKAKIKANKNDEYITLFFKERPKFDRSRQNIDGLCEKEN